MKTKTVLVLYSEKIEAFNSLKRFCEVKHQKYNTWSRKKFPTVFNGAALEKLHNQNISEVIEIMGEKIVIQ